MSNANKFVLYLVHSYINNQTSIAIQIINHFLISYSLIGECDRLTKIKQQHHTFETLRNGNNVVSRCREEILNYFAIGFLGEVESFDCI
ncbi:MAG: hypothetical protein AAF383_10990 [Cyanobacteria bacterium P01_A01_bin.83]